MWYFYSNTQALDSVHKEPEKVENNVFDALEAIIGDIFKTPFNLGYSVATNPAAPGAARRRYGASLRCFGPRRHQNGSKWVEQMEALAVAIGALPHEAFLSVAGPLFDLAKEDPDRAMQ